MTRSIDQDDLDHSETVSGKRSLQASSGKTAPNETGVRTIALLRFLSTAPSQGYSREEIIQHLAAYHRSKMSSDASRKMLEHDLATLVAAGIHLERYQWGKQSSYRVRDVLFFPLGRQGR